MITERIKWHLVMMLVDWIRLAEAIACVVTLSFYRPDWWITFWIWAHTRGEDESSIFAGPE